MNIHHFSRSSTARAVFPAFSTPFPSRCRGGAPRTCCIRLYETRHKSRLLSGFSSFFFDLLPSDVIPVFQLPPSNKGLWKPQPEDARNAAASFCLVSVRFERLRRWLFGCFQDGSIICHPNGGILSSYNRTIIWQSAFCSLFIFLCRVVFNGWTGYSTDVRRSSARCLFYAQLHQWVELIMASPHREDQSFHLVYERRYAIIRTS